MKMNLDFLESFGLREHFEKVYSKGGMVFASNPIIADDNAASKLYIKIIRQNAALDDVGIAATTSKIDKPDFIIDVQTWCAAAKSANIEDVYFFKHGNVLCNFGLYPKEILNKLN